MNFRKRFNDHITRQLEDKFHVFAALVGWENFEISVLELCSREEQGFKENYYLQEYLPLLNSSFISSTTEYQTFETLTSILKSKKPGNSRLEDSPFTRIRIWVYKFKDSTILPDGVEYANVSRAKLATGAAPQTIKKYLDTNVPEVFYITLNL